jgi:hypothetical protein
MQFIETVGALLLAAARDRTTRLTLAVSGRFLAGNGQHLEKQKKELAA